MPLEVFTTNTRSRSMSATTSLVSSSRSTSCHRVECLRGVIRLYTRVVSPVVRFTRSTTFRVQTTEPPHSDALRWSDATYSTVADVPSTGSTSQ
jgi:hypothetical protein